MGDQRDASLRGHVGDPLRGGRATDRLLQVEREEPVRLCAREEQGPPVPSAEPVLERARRRVVRHEEEVDPELVRRGDDPRRVGLRVVRVLRVRVEDPAEVEEPVEGRGSARRIDDARHPALARVRDARRLHDGVLGAQREGGDEERREEADLHAVILGGAAPRFNGPRAGWRCASGPPGRERLAARSRGRPRSPRSPPRCRPSSPGPRPGRSATS